MMRVRIHLSSFFKALTGCGETMEDLPLGGTLDDLLNRLGERFPKLAAMRKSMLVAVDVEYQKPKYVLREGETVSLFPPVQGG